MALSASRVLPGVQPVRGKVQYQGKQQHEEEEVDIAAVVRLGSARVG